MNPATGIDDVRAIADAVLYEGYLLYPYRASSSKNQSRWQFGVLGPPRASRESYAEAPGMSMQCLLEPTGPEPTVRMHLRCLQLQERRVQRGGEGGAFVDVEELEVDGRSVLSWHEAVECEVELPAYVPSGATASVTHQVELPGGEDVEPIHDAQGVEVGRIVRRRTTLHAAVTFSAESDGPLLRLTVATENVHPDVAPGKDDAIRLSLIGAHLLLVAADGGFVSLLEPLEEARAAAERCRQDRCYPVLAGPSGSSGVVLGSPIILYDHPEVAAESAGALFDSTEIDEILTLRIMTMTDGEKAEARATDPRAAAIIDRCDAMSPEALQQLHGVLRDPQRSVDQPVDPWAVAVDSADPFATGDVPWWDPAADESVDPEVDHVLIDGVRVAKGSLVRVHPSRRADAQDLFYADQVGRVTAVLSDVDGGTHVALVLVDDPAADLHDWYGRYLYFDPDELEPLDPSRPAREESHP